MMFGRIKAGQNKEKYDGDEGMSIGGSPNSLWPGEGRTIFYVSLTERAQPGYEDSGFRVRLWKEKHSKLLKPSSLGHPPISSQQVS